MLFMRYVLLGRLADGTRVFWDSRRGRAVKRVTRVRLKPGTVEISVIRAMVGSSMLLLGFRLFAGPLARLFAGSPLGDAFSALDLGVGNFLMLYTRPRWMTEDIWESSVIAILAVVFAAGLYWLFCRLVFGSDHEYEPATLREVAFASSRPAGWLRYSLGHPVVYLPFVLSLWGLPVFAASITFLELLPWWWDSLPGRVWFWWAMSTIFYPVLMLPLWALVLYRESGRGKGKVRLS